ncbi:putative Ccr4-Not transcription complex subunit [Xylona heveae TC161]|uniref:General negative regulator of transcription subunit 1 n=1 Tax=Xylona heveae (strain CBS 132557 / TC161) TaxID=1328760 RepID=A0A165A0F1_XYLHT|nr:putative Ccr4-Not transcription complex subunit [Xylona heveae TC161]KZF19773.1 putative Ccr4-Not transcription complex subunit [Xylona heveae TC161]
MTFPPSHQFSQESTVTGKEIPSGTRSSAPNRPPSVPAADHTATNRRILAPISTSIAPSIPSLSSPSRRGTSQSSPSRKATSSPFASTYSAALNPSVRRPGSRHNSGASSTASPFSPFQSGSQQLHSTQLLSSPRSRTIPSSSNPHLASSAAASTTASQGGGGGSSGGGGASRNAAYPQILSQSNISSPTHQSLNNVATTAPSPSTNSQAGQLSKIVIAQVFLLLSTIKEDKDKTKWESQADQIRKLIESNGMEVFSKYFRRLVVGNSPQIFPGINRPVENAGNYPLLVNEMQKAGQDFDQAQKIAETIDTSEGDIFRDFDLSTFLEHFKLDPVAKFVLALAFKTVSRADLRAKADAILSNTFQPFLHALVQSASERDDRIPQSFLASIIERLAQYPPRNLNDEGKMQLDYAISLRYSTQGSTIPSEVCSALLLVDILGPAYTLPRLVQRIGPKMTSSAESCREALSSAESVDFGAAQVATALLVMIISQSRGQYNPATFIAVVREHWDGHEPDWQEFFREFDRQGFRVDKDQFLALYKALLPLAKAYPACDIQSLWGGRWQFPATQLAFVTAFASQPRDALDLLAIPRLRRSFTADIADDAPDDVKEYAQRAINHPLNSLDAITALFDLAFQSNESLMMPESQRAFHEVVQHDMDIFLCSAFGVPRPWTDTQQSVLLRLFYPFLLKQHPNYSFVLHALWKQDKQWVATRLVETHSQDPMQLPLLFEHAERHGWLDELLMIFNGFGVDLAALAHRRGALDLEQWAQGNAQRGPQEFIFALSRFLTIKAEDELRLVRKEQPSQRTISLAVKTVNAMLDILEEHLGDRREELTVIQRLCIQAYPRLVNYGEGFDDIIDASGEESNAISEGTDAKMQEHYKRMYSGEFDVREVVELLQKYKTSRDPAEQDLFACMIHGLFDEYSCYHEYPLEALATTAVLFGGIINFHLIDGIPLRVGLGMVFEAVRDYAPESSMYKFGLQALIHFSNRLHEWPGLCSRLLQVPALQTTEIYSKAEEVLRDRAGRSSDDSKPDGLHAEGSSLPNGSVDEMFLQNSHSPRLNFHSIHVDPPLRPEIYHEPEEDVQDKVLFVLNNVSERNLSEKLADLRDALQDEHHQWFAGYLVEERAKLQPNFQQLYLDMLTAFNSKILWAEVLRETYASVVRMLNADSTMNSSTERSHLKNLGAWLGSLTIARDKPIKYKNISFKDLLIEGYDTQRLLVVIPFAGKVLIQAKKSKVFKPPNPWLMEIIRLLLELYHFAELKLNLKFEIEVLCKDLDLDYKAVEPSTSIRDRPQIEEEVSGQSIPDGLEGFDELSLSALNRPRPQNGRFSPGAILPSLPDLSTLLVYPPSSSTMISPARLRQIVSTAVQRAIIEIISPVVERSVTIATISTAQLIRKDFATEPDEEKVRQAALTMAKALAGSLALVTCKEPLRMSMTNYIRLMQSELPDQPLAEGAILMCVNDNLDLACSTVEKAAEQRAMPEIEAHINDLLVSRREHRAAHPNEPFIDPVINRWAFFMPDPYKQSTDGLNKEQLAIYEDFARQSRGPSTHLNVASQDASRQVSDVLQEQFPSVPHLPTPAEPPVVPHQAAQQKQLLQTAPLAIPSSQPQLNGFMDLPTLRDRVQDLLLDLQRAMKGAQEQRFAELSPDSPVRDISDQTLRLVVTSAQREEISLTAAQKICVALYTQSEKPLEIEVLVQLLNKLCQLSPATAREVILWLANIDDERVLNVPVTVSLLDIGLIEVHRVDLIITRSIQARKIAGLQFLSDLLTEVLFSDKPTALRADFAGSLEAMANWLAEDKDLTIASQLLQRLREAGIPETIAGPEEQKARAKRDQMEYIFMEWVGVCNHPSSTEKLLAAFIAQLHEKKVMHDREASAVFFRVCIDASVEAFEREERNPAGSLNDAFLCVDALAKLVVLLVKYQGESDGVVKSSKAQYLDSILSLIVLVLCHHHTMRGELFNQRVFFRLFSSILCEYHTNARQSPEQDKEVMLVFADKWLALQPLYFPAFAFGWLTLISHRIFMPGLLKMADEAGWEIFAQIMVTMLKYVGELLKPLEISPVAKDIYRGVLRILLVLHHDFPEFLADNHYRLCNVVPAHSPQLRNLILSAYPSSFPELPDPFTAGLKVDRLEEIRKSPVVAGDVEEPLQSARIKDVIDQIFQNNVIEKEQISAILEAISTPSSDASGVAFEPIQADIVLLNSIVLYTGMNAIANAGQKGGPTFSSNSAHSALLEQLCKQLRPEARYYLLSAIANQLRYPNSHTHYFSYALLHLFGTDQTDQSQSDVRQQVTRVLLERLIVHRPHPWGLIITLLELLKNPSYMFWDLPFVKAAPEIERLFGALFQHINQSPRALA